jgi:hypothetical protein
MIHDRILHRVIEDQNLSLVAPAFRLHTRCRQSINLQRCEMLQGRIRESSAMARLLYDLH